MAEFADRIKRYFFTNPRELRFFLIIAASFALILSFDQWGGDKFSAVTGFSNYAIAFFVVCLSLALNVCAKRFVGLKMGMRVNFQPWWGGLIVSLMAVIATNGGIMLFLAGKSLASPIAALRLGKFRHREELKEHALILLAGATVNILFAGVLTLFAKNNPIAAKAIAFNVSYALYSLLPLPQLDGGMVFFYSRVIYIFCFVGLLGFISMINTSGSLVLSLIVALFAGATGALMYSKAGGN